jgi:cell division transport system permease protein
MKLIFKEHISLIAALFTILFTLQVYFIIDRTIIMYENTLKNSYSMIAVSNKKIKVDIVKNDVKAIDKIKDIDPKRVVDRLRDELNKEDLGVLKENLPYFYRIFLKKYPSPKQLQTLKTEIEQINGIIRIETYSKTHNQIFKLLVLFKEISNVFLGAIFLVSTLLVIKEMRIWQFEHTDRMHIMALFGAPIWMRSAVLFKVAIFDAFISSILVVVTFLFLDTNGWLHELFSMISVDVDIFKFVEDTFKLLMISIFISFILAAVTILKNRENYGS